MKINDDHLYHGAALTQIAEHPSFKAINAYAQNGVRSRSAFLINTDIGIYLKYASEAVGAYDEFIFTFHQHHLKELSELVDKTAKVFVGLVCISERHICCLAYETLLSMIKARQRENGGPENSYTVLVTLKKGQRFRAYMSIPGRKKMKMCEQIIPRDDFPDCVFS